ncbi:hypothetical protein [Aphanothece sacrum]|uniref:Nonstructural polyprotein n=1 Tax=Aphanothece sacrum FPU1 TaxID=1920663 RepID=A0A401IJB4_APHSA|nr:hypothetical protein [Aphanothece sacrum]GBF81405.1 nonstructural polyprotein [Aphanothece sacrum FPU1]GBF85404.1 hypothetical protein AsFPU3_2463 [Aphanothece sacrum FPU3]
MCNFSNNIQDELYLIFLMESILEENQDNWDNNDEELWVLDEDSLTEGAKQFFNTTAQLFKYT